MHIFFIHTLNMAHSGISGDFFLNYFHLIKEATEMSFVLHFFMSLKEILWGILANIFKESFPTLHISYSCPHPTTTGRTSIKNWTNKSFKPLNDFTPVSSHSWNSVIPLQLAATRCVKGKRNEITWSSDTQVYPK